MRFSEFYSSRKSPVISFEVFPPKTSNGLTDLEYTLKDLADLAPDFITVTYGAMGTTRDRTLKVADYIKNELKIETACHLTCVGASRDEISSILAEIEKLHISNIVALRGDPPKGENSFITSRDGFSHADQLVRHIREYEKLSAGSDGSKFGIAVAGYPEKHVEAPSFKVDLQNLKRKADAGADVIITQLFFDNDHYFEFVKKVKDAGIDIPVVPGLMPILSASQIKKITMMCGSSISGELRQQLSNAGDHAEEIGIRHCRKQLNGLLEKGVPGVHFYVLNRSDHIRQILKPLLIK